MKNKMIRGIIPPMVTPLLDTDILDARGVENLVEHLVAGGVSGIFLLGTTGETQHLSFQLKAELIKKTSACLRGRLPLLVGITDTCVSESIRVAQVAAENQADAVLAAPPYYFTLGQPELIEYYKLLAAQTPLPLYLYNMPSHTKTMIEPETVFQLSQIETIIGLKDSSGNGVYFNKLLTMFRERPDFGVYVGPEEMLAGMVLLGAHGGISGGANVYPKIFVELYKAAAAKDTSQMIEIQDKMMRIGQELYNIGRFGSSYIKGIKTALSLKGICSDILAQPFHHFQETEKTKVKAAVERLDKILGT